ncbi:MAG: fused MFS/spermidine synthase [Sandaracinaceae bacterium]
MRRASTFGLLMATFLTGAVVMGLELAAFRLYAPHFGYSTYVWGSMIGIVMLALAVGYTLGGRLADRASGPAPLLMGVTAAGAYQGGILFVAEPILAALAELDPRVGPVLATLVIFAPPILALAMMSPFVTRLLATGDDIGRTAGRVSAISTAGSLVGVFGTSFVLVPWLGTRMTLIVMAVTSVAVGGVGLLLLRRRVGALAVLPLVAVPFSPPFGFSEDAIFVRESEYNLVRVVERAGERMLVLNDPRTAQTTRLIGQRWSDRYFDVFAVGPLLTEGDRLLVLGMGAGSSIVASRNADPELEVDAVEIDPAVVEAAARFFDIGPGPRTRVHTADARPWLAAQRGSWDIIHLDLFQGGLYPPFYLLTREAFEDVRARLAPGGVVMMNVYDRSPERPVLGAVGATLRAVFPSVYVVPGGRRNHIVLAFGEPTEAPVIEARLRAGHPDPQVEGLGLKAAEELRPLTESGPVLTDDHAPVEELTRRMLAAG